MVEVMIVPELSDGEGQLDVAQSDPIEAITVSYDILVRHSYLDHTYLGNHEPHPLAVVLSW